MRLRVSRELILPLKVFVAVLVILFPSGEVNYVTPGVVLDSSEECAAVLSDILIDTKEKLTDALLFPVCIPVTNTRGL